VSQLGFPLLYTVNPRMVVGRDVVAAGPQVTKVGHLRLNRPKALLTSRLA